MSPFIVYDMEHGLEYFGVLTGLTYLVLEIMQHRAMWVVGFITSLVYVFVFFFSKFYADMSLNVYYVAISVYGFWQWRREGKMREGGEAAGLMYRHLTGRCGIGVLVVATVLYGGMYGVLSRFTDSPVPAGDAFTTALSVAATWMLAKRILEHWWFWVVINLVSAGLYYYRGLYPTCFLFVCYGVLAVVGWMNWKKKGVLYDRQI